MYKCKQSLPYLLERRVMFCPYIWCINMWDCLKFMHKEPNHIALNQTTHHRIKACIIKSAHVQKRQNRGHLTLTNMIFFWTLSICWFVKKAKHFTPWVCFHLQAKKYETWWIPQTELFSVIWHHRYSKLVKICASEQV